MSCDNAWGFLIVKYDTPEQASQLIADYQNITPKPDYFAPVQMFGCLLAQIFGIAQQREALFLQNLFLLVIKFCRDFPPGFVDLLIHQFNNMEVIENDVRQGKMFFHPTDENPSHIHGNQFNLCF
jgi:hypothetical protein